MDWLTFLKDFLKNPIYFFFIAGAFFLFAPIDIKWISYILFAIAIASIVDFGWQKVKKRWVGKKENRQEEIEKEERRKSIIKDYENLNFYCKRIIDETIVNNSLFFINRYISEKYEEAILTLHILGFGQKTSSSRIAFNKEAFFYIKKKFGKKIKKEWEEEDSNE